MKEKFIKAIESFTIGDSIEVDRFVVFPIFAEEKTKNFITLDEAMKKHLVKITEVDSAGSVPAVRVINFAKKFLVIFVGEILVGAKQNRVVNTTIVVKPHSEIVIPVSCIEEGRWSYDREDFSDYDSYVYSQLRREILRDVNLSLKKQKSFYATQGKIWDLVDEKLQDLNVESPTRSLSEAYNANRLGIKSFVRKFKTLKDQIGAIIFTNGRFQVMEVCSNPEVFKKIYPKLIKSIYLDELKSLDKKKCFLDFLEKEIDYSQALTKLLSSIKNSDIDSFKGVGEGIEFRVEGEDVIGSAVCHSDKLLHLTIYSNYEQYSNYEHFKEVKKRKWRY